MLKDVGQEIGEVDNWVILLSENSNVYEFYGRDKY